METHLLYKTKFFLNERLYLPCPHCDNGMLKLDDKDFYFKMTEELKRSSSQENKYLEMENIEYKFHGTFKCVGCGEVVVSAGIGGMEEDQVDENKFQFIETFYPKIFIPTIPLFKIDRKCPHSVRREIESAFALYWSDLPACANKIRIAVEQIMNDKKVKKVYFSERENKEKRYSLHRRIEIFGATFPKYKDYVTALLALKYIGNDGSHIGSLNTSDLVAGFELLEETYRY
jgi:hypothetical protein